MTDSAGGNEVPAWGTEEWYKQLDEPVSYEPLDLSFENNVPEPTMTVEGANSGHALVGAPLRVSYVRSNPQLDPMGIPVREITGTVTTSSGHAAPIRLTLEGWNPETPDAPAHYVSRPLGQEASEAMDLLPLVEGDVVTFQIGSQTAGIDYVHEDRFDFELWQKGQLLEAKGTFLAGVLRTYRAGHEGSTDPIVVENIRVLTEGVRTAQLGLDHLHDPAPTPIAKIERAKYYLMMLPVDAQRMKLLIDGKTIPTWFYRDERRQAELVDGNERMTFRKNFETVVADAEIHGTFYQSRKIRDALDELTKDLLIGSYDYVVDRTPWTWALPLAGLVLTGEATDHHGRKLTKNEVRSLGIQVGLMAIGAVGKGIKSTSRFTPGGASAMGTGALEELENQAGSWASKKIVGDIETLVLEGLVTGIVDSVKQAGHPAPPPPASEPSVAPVVPISNNVPQPVPAEPDDKGRGCLIPLILAALVLILGLGAFFALSGDDSSLDETSDPPPDQGVVLSDEVGFIPSLIEGLGSGPNDGWWDLVVDPDGGLSWSRRGEAGLALTDAQIRAFGAALGFIDIDMAAQIGGSTSYPCGAATADYTVTCPAGAGAFAAGDYVVVYAEHEAAFVPGSSSIEYGVAFDDDGDSSDNYKAPAQFDADFFHDTEHWYRLRIERDGTRTMWVDGITQGVPGVFRPSSALVVQAGAEIVWLIPRSELPGDSLRYRSTVFGNQGAAGEVPDPATSGGDVSGLDVDGGLTAISLEAVPFDQLDALPPDVEHTIQRLTGPADEPSMIAALMDSLVDRIDEDPVGALHPQLRANPACVAVVESTVAVAQEFTFANQATSVDLSNGLPVYSATASIDYGTGPTEFEQWLVPGGDGHLYLFYATC